nr:MAG TPA: hypothetical protein [Caudoviricetes sp.]
MLFVLVFLVSLSYFLYNVAISMAVLKYIRKENLYG